MLATGINSVDDLLDKINNTNKLEIRNELMQKLSKQLLRMDKKNLIKAQELINTKLLLSFF